MVKTIALLLFTISITYADTTPFPPEEPISPVLSIASHAQKRSQNLSNPVALYLGYLIKQEALKRNLDPLLMAAIISVESDFRFIEVNHTGDYGITQINYRVWSQEFRRLRVRSLSKERLVNDSHYSIKIMAEILEITRKRFPNDPLWFARYHSSTVRFKNIYAEKVKNRLTDLKNGAKLLETELATNQGDNQWLYQLIYH